MSVFLILSLTACSSRIVQVPVDPRLTVDCKVPEVRGDTWRDLASAYLERGEALEECTQRMRVIRGQ